MSNKIEPMRELGKILIIFGGTLIVVGIVLWNRFGTGWFGHLPGDIRIVRGDSVFYFPVITCILVSVILTVLLSLFRR